jgi:2-methylfumaryl-CoA hydratase
MSSVKNIYKVIEPKYGRLLDDFSAGDIYHHPWEVTLDDGMLAMFAASFLDPNPLYSSRRFARDIGFRDKVAHPIALLNLALSFSVHDVSEQTIVHLAYNNLRFPNAAYAGDTLTVFSEVIATRVSETKPDRGVVHVRTVGLNQDGAALVIFERKALIPVGSLRDRAHPPLLESHDVQAHLPNTMAQDALTQAAGMPVRLGNMAGDKLALPQELALEIKSPRWRGRPRGLYEDFDEGLVIAHDGGRTIGESEHMQLTNLSRNSHPLHFDEVYSRERSIAGTRIICGGLVFGWVASLASRDTTANAIWEVGFDRGSHPAPVIAGDTLYAASRVIEKRDHNEHAGMVRFHLVGVKNERPGTLVRGGVDIFDQKPEQKVFEIERTVLLPKRASIARP